MLPLTHVASRTRVASHCLHSASPRCLHVASTLPPTFIPRCVSYVLPQRKKLLGDMALQMADEVRAGLAAETADQAAKVVQIKLEPMLAEEAERFNMDTRFQEAVGEALKTKRSVELAAVMLADKMHAPKDGLEGGLEAAIERVAPLLGNVVDLSTMALGQGGSDVKVVVAWMDSIPSALTKLKIDLPKSSAEVVAALRQLVAQTTTLVELDMMEERAAHLNVLQLNGTEKVKSIDLSNKGLGPLSVAIVASCIQANAFLESLKCKRH